MLRRRFLSVLAVLATPFIGAARASERKPDTDETGDPLADVYRLTPGKGWLRCGRLDPKPGDEILILGWDANKVWALQRFKVGDEGAYVGPDGKECVMPEGATTNYLGTNCCGD